MSLLPTAPRSIGGVLDDGIRLYRKSLGSCLLVALLASLLIVVPTLIFIPQAVSVAAGGPGAMLTLFRSPTFLLTIVVVSVVYVGFYNAAILRIHGIAIDEPLSLGAALGQGLRRALPMLGFWIIFMLVISVGTVLLVIPGIYLWGIFQLGFVALLVENAGVFESFGISRRLIKGHWWRSATIMAVALIIMIVFSFLVGIVAGITAGIMMGVFHADQITNVIVQQGISTIFRMFLLSLFPSFLLAMYYDLKLRNEGSDLEDRIAALTPAN